jgi:hypothetical protein
MVVLSWVCLCLFGRRILLVYVTDAECLANSLTELKCNIYYLHDDGRHTRVGFVCFAERRPVGILLNRAVKSIDKDRWSRLQHCRHNGRLPWCENLGGRFEVRK